jgi:hypothetical protein
MIRIDEIYDNVLLPHVKTIPNNALHWFDPFGTTAFNNLVAEPKINGGSHITADKQIRRIIMWDQEPIHLDRFSILFEQFIDINMPTPANIKTFRLVSSEYNSDNMHWIRDTYGLNCDYYFFHAWAALDWYRGYNRTSLAQPFQERKPYNTFLCPNNIIGGERRHRIEMLQQFVGRDLLDKNLISFPDVCPYEGQSLELLCVKYELDCPKVRLPLMIDNGSGYAAKSHQIDLWGQANNSLIHVVTETVYRGNRNHLTEKSFKPIVMQQPFIIQSCKGSLEYLRRYGFKTFGDFWDESYDEADDSVRTYEIGKLIQNINSMSQKEKSQLQTAVNSTVEHNFNWFYGAEFEKLLWQELTEMMNRWQT